MQLLNVAIEHRLMHVETLSYMLHQLPIDRKYRREDRPAQRHGAPGPSQSITIPQGTATWASGAARMALSAGTTNSRNTPWPCRRF